MTVLELKTILNKYPDDLEINNFINIIDVPLVADVEARLEVRHFDEDLSFILVPSVKAERTMINTIERLNCHKMFIDVDGGNMVIDYGIYLQSNVKFGSKDNLNEQSLDFYFKLIEIL